jgi:hypothetical protein
VLRLQHRSRHGAHAEIDAPQVHGDHSIPGLEVSAEDRRGGCDARVQVGDVEPAEAIERLTHDGLVGLGLRDVQARSQRLTARRLDLLRDSLGSLAIEIRGGDPAAGSRERQRARAPDPRCSAGDQRDLALELLHDESLPGSPRE